MPAVVRYVQDRLQGDAEEKEEEEEEEFIGGSATRSLVHRY